MTSKRPAILLGAALVGLAGAPSAFAASKLDGYWMVDRYVEALTTAQGKSPPLKPEARKVYAANRALKAKGDLSFDPVAKCVSPGTPRLMFLPYPLEIISTPTRVAILSGWNRHSRTVELARKAPEADYPLYLGVSDGKWVGDALVVTTRDLSGDTWLDASGLPHSENLKVTERLSVSADGKTLTDLMTLEDPDTFTRSWQAKATYRRLPDTAEIVEDVCLDRLEAGEPAVKTPANPTR
jgi:hypothetical protein